MSAELDLQDVVPDPEPERVWPHSSETYEVFVAKLPDCDDPPEFVSTPPDEVQACLYEAGTGQFMDEMLFDPKDIPTRPGLHRLKLRYWQEWKSWGAFDQELEYGFKVIESELVGTAAETSTAQ